jgi:hypothetical protein
MRNSKLKVLKKTECFLRLSIALIRKKLKKLKIISDTFYTVQLGKPKIE